MSDETRLGYHLAGNQEGKTMGSEHVPKSPRELYRIAKRQGTWDPEDIPVAEDRVDWQRLTRGQQE